MNALKYARKKIVFQKSSPITGAFDDSRYPFIRKPLLALDDINCKCLVWYKPAQAIGTVALQIATAYRLDIKRKSVMCVAQTDSDAKDFSIVKLQPFLKQIPSLVDTVSGSGSGQSRYSITQAHWLWATHELLINGPGDNATESKSILFLHTDEAHLWCVNYPGAFVALENRMGEQWNSQGVHVTTAADKGTEVDQRFYKGKQNEWHQSCPDCGKLIWPLWINDENNPYNGEEIWHWKDSQSETEMLDSIRMVCPHCSSEIFNTPENRRHLNAGADYVPMNPESDELFNSFRWNVFAATWKPWRKLFSKYLGAVHKAQLGDTKDWYDWVKKNEVRTNDGSFPMTDRSTVHILKKWAEDEETARFMAVDPQAGKEGEGVHWWAGVGEYDRDGNSNRIAYEKLLSWGDVYAFQMDNLVKVAGPETQNRSRVAIDCGYRDKEVFGRCAEWKWYALKGMPQVEFEHVKQVHPSLPPTRFTAPYSEPWTGNSTIGKSSEPFKGRQILPPQFCLGMFWSNPTIYAMFYALRTGQAGRIYGIPDGFSPDFIKQYQAFIPFKLLKNEEQDKPTPLRPSVPEFKNIKPGNEHAWDVECQCLVLAIVNGYFPLDYSSSNDIVTRNEEARNNLSALQ